LLCGLLEHTVNSAAHYAALCLGIMATDKLVEAGLIAFRGLMLDDQRQVLAPECYASL
jgi:hypothetical protein